MSTCKRVYIVEGPDGAGKTTLARQMALDLDARYVHFSSMPRVTFGLARMYVEAMLPALLGYQDVVMDRCWLSEVPYGRVFRGGANRLDPADVRMLERLAMKCGAGVVLCMPTRKLCVANFMSRKATEMLDDEMQLSKVYDIYRDEVTTELPMLMYNYEEPPPIDNILYHAFATPPHPLDSASAGNWDAHVVLVGDEFAHHKDNDTFYQWPFASFGDAGCSRWLTRQLAAAGIFESDLLWINSDQDLRFLGDGSTRRVIALGRVAGSRLIERGIRSEMVAHPQAWKRFHFDQPYRLMSMIRGQHGNS
jgi:thymidylate kinase